MAFKIAEFSQPTEQRKYIFSVALTASRLQEGPSWCAPQEPRDFNPWPILGMFQWQYVALPLTASQGPSR